jgi:hypothetical protein
MIILIQLFQQKWIDIGLKIYSKGYTILILIEKIWQKRKGRLFQAPMKIIQYLMKNGLYRSQIAEKAKLSYLSESFLPKVSMRPMI